MFCHLDLHKAKVMRQVNFTKEESHPLSPFSSHSIVIWGETFLTVEHAYQAAKFEQGPVHERVKNVARAGDARLEARKHKDDQNVLVRGFNKEAVMEELFRAKLTQHPEVALALKATSEEELVAKWDNDYYWSVGKDGSGENKLGKLWMKLRSELLGHLVNK